MIRKIAQTGVIAMVFAGTAIIGSGLPAHASTQVQPIGEHIITYYYSSAQHTEVVGENVQGIAGCASSRWGTTSKYVVVKVVQGCG